MSWMWTPQWSSEDDKEPRFVYFRKEIFMTDLPETYEVLISADSRYKLYINGKFVQAGPEKGNQNFRYCDKADIISFLVKGKNVIAVEVLRYPSDNRKRNQSLIGAALPGLYIKEVENNQGVLCDEKGWKCKITEHIRLMRAPFEPSPMHILEDVTADISLQNWKMPGYDDSTWQPVEILASSHNQIPCNLTERDIPYQISRERRFEGVVCVREPEDEGNLSQEWNDLLKGAGRVRIPSHTTQLVEISAGELMTGFLELNVSGGKDSKITLHCAECYAQPPENPDTPGSTQIKGDRTDWQNGQLYGCKDYYRVAGYGAEENPEYYEPYWFRTFRFIGITVETGEEELVVEHFTYRETGYPLEVKTQVETSDDSLKAIWDISERTLRRCMHETYMDCPFYEQLQYVMDARAEALYTYAISADDRLARKCMDDFRASQREDGLINACAPSSEENVIPGFAIYYILMVHDHMMYFGDKELVMRHFPAIENILNFFKHHLAENGMLGQIGGPLFQHKYWSFIDWTTQWNDTFGMPSVGLEGPVTMESLLYLLGLQKAAGLADYLGMVSPAEEYRGLADSIKEAIQTNCIGKVDSVMLLQDGPGMGEYSVHCQVFAILTGLVTAEQGKKMLQLTVGNPAYAQCSVAMGHYLFQALKICGWYEKTQDMWDLWRRMIRNHLTTCVENDTDERSDCHAWGSAILYELPANSLGVNPIAPGFEAVSIKPETGYFDFCMGDVITPHGTIHVEWEKLKNGQFRLDYWVPSGIRVAGEIRGTLQ